MKSLFMMAAIPMLTVPAFAQYYQPNYYSSPGNMPVVVPPTVITTAPQEQNSSKKSCKESMIDMFLVSIRRTTGDCTP